MEDEVPFRGNMFTVIMHYGATGEGSMCAVMYTRGYGPNEDRKKNALENFALKYGTYYAHSAYVIDGMVFDFAGRELLVSDKLVDTLKDFAKDAGGLEYTSCLYYNFS